MSTRRSLPPCALDELHALRGGDDAHQWLLGQTVERLALEYAGRISLSKIYADAAAETEYSRGQVRSCHETWQGTDDDLRESYDMLTFQHFRVVVLYCPDRQARAGALQWCLDSADAFGGKPAPAAKLAAKLRPGKLDPTWTALRERLAKALSNLQAVEENERRHKWLSTALETVEGWQPEQVTP